MMEYAGRISIHAPHEGERPYFTSVMDGRGKFQSTLPTRGSDGLQHRHAILCRAISIHAPHEGERPSDQFYDIPVTLISIHAPHEGERRNCSALYFSFCAISIHAPHEGERPISFVPHGGNRAISIHAPHEGERQRKSAFVCSISANLLNIIHCGTVTRAVSRRRIALFRLFSVRRSGVFMYAYASH